MYGLRTVVASLSAILASSLGQAQVAPLTANLGDCQLRGGGVIKDCFVAYRTFGTLNAGRDNAVLRTTGFQVRTSAPGRTNPPNKYLRDVDTTRFFLILVDPLGNGASSSPSNSRLQPGNKFPFYTIHDMVESQYRLLTEHLRVKHLHAVIGGSMGGMQALEWAVSHPEYVGRVVSNIGSPKPAAYDRLRLTTMLWIIEAGLRLGLPPDSVMLSAMRFSMTGESTPTLINRMSPDSAEAVARGQARDALRIQTLEDAASQLRAMLAHDISAAFGGDMDRASKAIRMPLLAVYSPDDHMVTPGGISALARAAGADTLSVPSICGHGVQACEGPTISPVTRRFLER